MNKACLLIVKLELQEGNCTLSTVVNECDWGELHCSWGTRFQYFTVKLYYVAARHDCASDDLPPGENLISLIWKIIVGILSTEYTILH